MSDLDLELEAMGALERFFKSTTDPFARNRVITWAASLGRDLNARDWQVGMALGRALCFQRLPPLIRRRRRRA